MANSPAKRHFSRIRAAEEAAGRTPAQLMDGATIYEQHMAQLHQDRLRLKQIQSDQGKAELKRQLLPAYASYIEGVLAGGKGAADEVVTTIMVWCIDAGEFAAALTIASYVLHHGLAMPDRFARTTGCLVAEEIAEAALKAQRTGEAFDVATLERAVVLTGGQDMPDEVRAKLHLALGRSVLIPASDDTPPPREQLEACVGHLRRAIDLHSSCGGKKDLERAERLLKKHAATGDAGNGGDSGS